MRTSSRGGRRKGHSGWIAPSVLCGIVCGLLLLYGCLTVALSLDTFLNLTLLPLGAVPLRVTPLATCEIVVAVVPIIPLCFLR